MLGEIELAKCYEEGKGVEIDLNTATNLFLQRAEQSDLDGMMGLSRCFMKGFRATQAERRQLAVQISTKALEIIKGDKKHRFGKIIYSYNQKRKLLVICGSKPIQYYEDGTKATEMGSEDGNDQRCPWLDIKEIESVIICFGISSIKNNAFNGDNGYNMQNLQAVYIPESVTYIGDCAFSGCTKLQSITIPSSVTSIGGFVFRGCTSLKAVYLQANIETIDTCMFLNCSSLKTVKIPKSVTTISDSVFDGCISLTSVEIPKRVTKIGNSCFSHCTLLESVVLPPTLTYINERMFMSCQSLKTIAFPQYLEHIYAQAFSGCESLKSLVFPDKLVLIDHGAFENCTKLKEIKFTGSVPKICKPFEGCWRLKTVHAPKNAFIDKNGMPLFVLYKRYK